MTARLRRLDIKPGGNNGHRTKLVPIRICNCYLTFMRFELRPDAPHHNLLERRPSRTAVEKIPEDPLKDPKFKIRQRNNLPAHRAKIIKARPYSELNYARMTLINIHWFSVRDFISQTSV